MREEKSGEEWDNDSKPKHTSYLNLLRRPGIHGDHGQAMPTPEKSIRISDIQICDTRNLEDPKRQMELNAWNEFPPSFRH